MKWYQEKTDDIILKLKSDLKNGLDPKEAELRILEYGKNKFKEKKRKNPILQFLEQFKDFMVIVLIIAAVVSFGVSYIQGEADFLDPIIILVIVFFNAVLGFVQESRAEKALEALKKMSVPTARVLRDGKVKLIDTELVVPGDIIIVEAGDYVCADARLLESISLKTEESALTGESIASEKNCLDVYSKDMAIGDRANMIFAGSSISFGRGKAVVVATGMKTEMGKIAEMIMQNEENLKTPLQERLAHTGKVLGTGAVFICIGIFLIGIIRQLGVFEMFITSVSLAVAAIPEGLPAIVTVMLAIGVQTMAKKNAVIRKLPAVETLGSATIICSDKTGTLTQNKMKVVEIFPLEEKERILRLGSLCNNSFIEADKSVVGEGTENALIYSASENGIDIKKLREEIPRVKEFPFDSERKLMTTVHKDKNGFISVTKGAFDFLIKKCDKIYENGEEKELNKSKIKLLKEKNREMAENALRVIAVAYKNVYSIPKGLDDGAEEGLTFLGFFGMIDPPRKEARTAVSLCKKAGIKPVMITGDHALTAAAVAEKIGISEKGDLVITGEELSKMSEEELSKNIFKYSVFARVSPEHKMRIVKAFKSKGAVVAMTGDGVNDAPALKMADIGCAMGITGTDVAKGASDMVLTDDNFATVVDAVKYGRGIYSNIKKAVHFLLSSNIGEITSIFVAMVMGFHTPLLAIHLLWVNLVTDSFPAVALGLEPVDENIMNGRQKGNVKSLFDKTTWFGICFEGMMIGMLTLLAFAIGHVCFDKGDSAVVGRTMAFATLSISQLVHAFNMKSEGSILYTDLFNNIYLIGSFILGIALQAGVIMIPVLADIFKVVPLSAIQWLIIVFLCVVPVAVVEAEKYFAK